MSKEKITTEAVTTIEEIAVENSIISEKPLHSHGFVKLVGVFGSDEDIEKAARISYGTAR